MIGTKKRSVSSDGAKVTKKPKLEKPNDAPAAKSVKKKFTPKANHDGGDDKKGKFQKKLTPGGKKDGFRKDFKGKDRAVEEKKPFVENTPESKREYWNSLKTKQKELRDQRRKSKTKDLYELSVGAKKIYETLKRKSTENKEKLVSELHEKLNKDNTYSRIATSHDTARVIQCMIKNASEDLRMQIAEKLIPEIYEISTSKYGHHCITSLLKNGSKPLWAKVVDGIIKHVVKMASHSFSAAIIDSVYNEHATNEQKAFMRQAFYSEIYKQTKDKKVTCMKDTWETNAFMKKTVISTVKGHLLQAANKQLTDNALLHSLLLDFLQEAGELERTEVIELYLPHLAAISSTKDGTSAAIFCFLNSVVKDRRAALKTLKQYVTKLTVHEHGHRLVLCILNCYDDTVILGKQLVSVILEHVETVVASGEWGRKVVGWIFSPADKDLLHPTQIEILDGYLKHSKKDKEIRRREVFASAVEPFCTAVEGNASFWLRGGHTTLLTAAIVKNLTGEHLGKVHQALAKVVSDPEWQIQENEVNLQGLPMVEEKSKPAAADGKKGPAKIRKIKKSPFAEEKEKAREKQLAANPLINGIEHAGVHIALKKIIKLDQEKRQEDASSSQFGSAVLDNLTEEVIKSWIVQNRPCFLLLLIFENSSDPVQKQLKQKLKSAKPDLKKQTHTGAKLLVEKLKL
ncbi:protein penguin [Ochlerotatus camptorhynchus]|uniref:protein penguin n=1 Tax=Ochlerotatus camptorhynchus TaxID=644619 RepID=UPI0031D99C4F